MFTLVYRGGTEAELLAGVALAKRRIETNPCVAREKTASINAPRCLRFGSSGVMVLVADPALSFAAYLPEDFVALFFLPLLPLVTPPEVLPDQR